MNFTYVGSRATQTRIEKILIDPFQMHQTITTLEQAGLPIEAFPQTQPNSR